MNYDYSKLTEKIIEVYGTQAAFALAMDMSQDNLCKKLNNLAEWSQEEMFVVIDLLYIPASEIEKYFFSHNDLEN